MIINIGRDFSVSPSGISKNDNKSSAEHFRELFLVPALLNLKNKKKLIIIIDDVHDYYSAAFLKNAFGGLVSINHFNATELLKKINIQFSDKQFFFYKQKIIQYINDADLV